VGISSLTTVIVGLQNQHPKAVACQIALAINMLKPNKLLFWLVLVYAVMLFVGLWLSACGEWKPCTYKGKSVNQNDANRMKEMGMDVHCMDEDK